MKYVSIKVDSFVASFGAIMLIVALLLFSVDEMSQQRWCNSHHGIAEVSSQLQAGDLVQHRVHDWHGVVLWNNDDNTIAIRFYDADSSSPTHSNVWHDTVDAEWEPE